MKWGIEAIKSYELNCNGLDRFTFLGEEYQSTNWSYLSLSSSKFPGNIRFG
nr:hypothetical protein [Bacillus toyonensis]